MPSRYLLLRLLSILLLCFASLAFSSIPNLKGQNQLSPGVEHYRLLVKFRAEVVQDIAEQQVMFSSQAPASKAAAIHAAQSFIPQFTYRQVVQFTPSEKVALQRGQVPPVAPGQFDYFAYRGMAYVVEAETMTPAEVLKLAEKFEQLAIVEYAALEPVEPIMPPFVTPDFTSYQYYSGALYAVGSDVIGINAQYAWDLGITGQGVKIADIEWGFNYQHEDLASDNFIEVISTLIHDYDDHGTAVAGIMIAQDNGYGMKGMVHGADKFFGVSEIRFGRVAGIIEGLRHLNAGDVFLYEMQTGGQNNKFVPADFNQAVWDVTKSATDAGVIIVAAAGNGSENLDDTFYDSYRARGDNGSIIVGAGTRAGRNRASFSSYGSPVHLQGWGDWSVATTGYGNLYNGGANATYTSSFSGTSAATPIVASAVVAVQSWYKREYNSILAPKGMRELLIATGTGQGSGGHIGPLPNIQAAIEQLRSDESSRLHAPSQLRSDNITQYSFNLNWQSVPQALGYKVRIATDSEFINLLPGYQNLDVGNATSLDVTNLNPDTTYYSQVQAYNQARFSSYSATLATKSADLALFIVTASASGGGVISPEQQQVASGATASFTLNANLGYRLESVTGCSGVLQDNIYTTAPILENCNVSATFTLLSDNGGGSSRYQYLANGSIVLDTVTGLEWQRCSVGQTWNGSGCSGVATRYNWQQAKSLVAPAGFSLPSVTQLRTLVYCSNVDAFDSAGNNNACGEFGSFNSPTIDLVAFPNAPANLYWSSTPFLQSSDVGWYVNFFDGFTNSSHEMNVMSVRFVRSATNSTIAAPTNLMASSITPVSFFVNWESASTTAKFRVDVATDAAFTQLLPTYNDFLVSDDTGVLVTGLLQNRQYFFRVRAISNDAVSANSETLEVTTLQEAIYRKRKNNLMLLLLATMGQS